MRNLRTLSKAPFNTSLPYAKALDFRAEPPLPSWHGGQEHGPRHAGPCFSLPSEHAPVFPPTVLRSLPFLTASPRLTCPSRPSSNLFSEHSLHRTLLPDIICPRHPSSYPVSYHRPPCAVKYSSMHLAGNRKHGSTWMASFWRRGQVSRASLHPPQPHPRASYQVLRNSRLTSLL